MKKLLLILGFLAVTSTPSISLLQVSTSTEIMTNKDNYRLIELEKQKQTIQTFGEYNQELYIGMYYGYLAKMNASGKITEIPVAGESSRIFYSIKEFNGDLYLLNNRKIFKITTDGKIELIFEVGDFLDYFKFLQVFNNELYFTYISVGGISSLAKISKEGTIRKVLDFKDKITPLAIRIKTFNNHLYVTTRKANITTISKIDANGQLKELHQLNFKVSQLVNFANALYLCLNNGSLLKLNTNDKIKTIVERNLKFFSSDLVVFQNELYWGNSNKLEKLTKDNKIKVIVKAKASINTLAVFNNELYIGMNEGYFAKLN